MLNLKDFNAVGDGVTDDTDAIDEWLDEQRTTGEKAEVPPGTYKYPHRLLLPQDGGLDGFSYTIEGKDPYRSRFLLHGAPTNQGPVVHLYTATNTPTSSYTRLSGVGFVGDTPNVFFAVGLEDLSDNVGNMNFTDCFFGNDNSTSSDNAYSLLLNYVFDSTFTNCVQVGKVGYGTALGLVTSHFNSWYGGSFSNAARGVRFKSTSGIGGRANTFVSPDFENLAFGIVSEEDTAGGNKFINPYFDIWRPDLNQPGTRAIYSSACNSVGLIVDQPYATSRTPSPLVSSPNNVGVTIRTT